MTGSLHHRVKPSAKTLKLKAQLDNNYMMISESL